MADDIPNDPAPAPGADPAPAPAADPAADPAGDPAPTGKTAVEAGGADPAPVPAPSTWPENWRQEMAKTHAGADSGDGYDKELKRLERMSNPSDAYKSMRELETRVSSGELKAKSEFPTEGTDEEKAKWRQESGVPAEAKGYLDSLDGIVIGEGDQPMVDAFLAASHESNTPPDAVRTAVDWYFKAQEQQAADQSAVDTEFHNESVETLRADMGADYQRNMQDMKAWLSNAPEGMADNLFGARLADGSLLGDNPTALTWLVSQMREINPLSTIVPGGGGDAMASVEQEIKEIQTMIATEPGKYWADSAKQERFAKLVAARDKQKNKAA